MTSDRRKFMRFDISLDVAVKTSKESGEHLAGTTKNFSRSGLCFEAEPLGLSLNDEMELELKLPGQNALIPVAGNVAWKEQSAQKCWIGIEFSDINKEAKSQILDYAYDRWVEKNRSLNTAG